MQKNRATEKDETKKSAAIAKRVEESRREEDKEGTAIARISFGPWLLSLFDWWHVLKQSEGPLE